MEDKVFYFDRSDIVPAAFVKLFLRVPVVIRILGVYIDQKRLVTSSMTKLINPLKFAAYKTRFNLAVCTQDGSGVEYYVDKLLNSKTPKIILLNGVAKQTTQHNKITFDKTTLLFVGKLSKEKGILELIEGVKKLRDRGYEFILEIVGKGNLIAEIKRRCNEIELNEYVKMAGSVSQKYIQKFYANADIYISLNQMGNLSNTVLEAMSAGKCIVMLAKDDQTHTDIYTEKVISEGTVIRIDPFRIVDELTEKLSALLENKEEIERYSKRMCQFAETFLWSWDERINYEIELLKKMIPELKPDNKKMETGIY